MSQLSHNYPLKELNTFGVQASAKYFALFKSEEELINILENNEIDKNNLIVLGGGSNVLFVDDFNGTILKNEIKGIDVLNEYDDKIILSIGSGENWDDVVEYAVNNNYYGIENLSLIPGSVGAAPIQNIGAYGVELKNVFYSLEGYFIDSLEKQEFTLNECNFGYRESIFKKELKDKFIITKVNLQLSKTRQINLNYFALKNYFDGKNNLSPSIQEIRSAVIDIRTSKLPDPKIIGNAGSFFKNPIIKNVELETLKIEYPDISFFELDNVHSKIAAGWLIEKCGFKGKRVGNVGSYKDQALVIVNYSGATGKEIINYAKEIQSKIMNEFGIFLELEVNIINNNLQE